ncbi:hypothetical protein [Streptomyces sparsus]
MTAPATAAVAPSAATDSASASAPAPTPARGGDVAALPVADCHVTPDGDLVFLLRPELPGGPRTAALDGAELVLSPKQPDAGAPVPLPLEPASADLAGRPLTGSGRVRAVLPPTPGLLAEGRWSAHLALPGREPVPLSGAGLLDTRHLLTSPHLTTRPLLVRLPYRAKDGTLALRVWDRARHVEAGDVRWTPQGELTVEATLFADPAPSPADPAPSPDSASPGPVLEIVHRGGTAEPGTVEAVRTGGRSCRFVLQPEDFAPLARRSTDATFVADLFVRAGTARHRLGRILDDVPHKKRVFVFPSRTVTLSGGGRLKLSPYYTVDNNLSVEGRLTA